MAWRQFVLDVDSIDAERAESVLLDLGALSVTFADAGDDPILEPAPGETPLWRVTRVSALFDADADLDEVGGALAAALGITQLRAHRIEEIADRIWEREWMKDLQPLQFGKRLWVVPGEVQEPGGPRYDGAVVIRLDPGLAFGTGTHPTTALCLTWLAELDLQDRTVLDFGCGSGILGVAALMLGAREVHAVDIDLQAVAASRQNAERNGVGDRLCAARQLPSATKRYDVLVANILASTLIENAKVIGDVARPGGTMALSGILRSQADEVADAYREAFDLLPPATMGEWALLSGTRK